MRIVKALRTYGMWLIEDLTLDELEWRPPESNTRTISSYFRHIINAEIYWLQQLGVEEYTILPKAISIDEMKKRYMELENLLIKKIEEVPKDEIQIVIPEYFDGKLAKMGSLIWMVLRTSLHAVHHYGQISHIRYTFGKPPNPDTQKFSWGQVMDLIALSSIQQ